jgi:hypothetical protein
VLGRMFFRNLVCIAFARGVKVKKIFNGNTRSRSG